MLPSKKNYSSNNPQDHTETDKNFKDTQSWSEVVRRKSKGKGRKGMREKGAGSVQGGRKQLEAQEHMGDINLYPYLGSTKFGVSKRSVPRVL